MFFLVFINKFSRFEVVFCFGVLLVFFVKFLEEEDGSEDFRDGDGELCFVGDFVES